MTDESGVTEESSVEETTAEQTTQEQTPQEQPSTKVEQSTEEVEATKETYDIRPPTGLDQSAVDRIVSFATERGLSNEAAQALVENEWEAVERFKVTSAEAAYSTAESWLKQAQEDEEIGGDKFDESVRLAQHALTELANDDLKELFNKTGLGNHPDLIRMFTRLGKYLQGDSFGQGNANGGNKEVSPEALFYDNTKG